jgi:hypothetical protein
MKKFSAIEYVSSMQEWAGDIPILRWGDVYLIAAKAGRSFQSIEIDIYNEF